MKNSLVLLLMVFATFVQAQAKFGVKLGLSTPSGTFGSFNVSSPDANFRVTLKDAKYGLNGGVWLRAGKRFFIQPELYFNSNTNQYSLDGGGFSNTVKTEKFQFVDMPIILGMKLGPLSLQAGPVAHYFVKSSGDLLDLQSYSQMVDEFTFGYQAGGGLDFGRIGLDVRYQGRFKNSDGHMTFFGTQYQFDKTPATVVASLRIKLF